MKEVNVYEQYFSAHLVFNEVERYGAKVMLIAVSDAGTIRYEAAVSFFPHTDEEDFAVSYDACFSKELYADKGRRSKKREKALLTGLQAEINALAAEQGGEVYWDKPLGEERRG